MHELIAILFLNQTGVQNGRWADIQHTAKPADVNSHYPNDQSDKETTKKGLKNLEQVQYLLGGYFSMGWGDNRNHHKGLSSFHCTWACSAIWQVFKAFPWCWQITWETQQYFVIQLLFPGRFLWSLLLAFFPISNSPECTLVWNPTYEEPMYVFWDKKCQMPFTKSYWKSK